MYYDYNRFNLKDHKSAQCSVRVYDNRDVVFQSYATDVIYYRHSTGMVYCTGTYSATTRKQIGWFLREYFPMLSYRDMSNCVANGDTILYNDYAHVRSLTPAEQTLIQSCHLGCTLSPADFDRIERTEAL